MIERYKHEAITPIWAPTEVYRRWYQVEIAHMQEVAGKEVADMLRLVKPPSSAQVNYYERETGHDVAAFLRALDKNVQAILGRLNPDRDDAGIERLMQVRSSLHYGLTSSDVVDTALAMGLQQCAPIVDALIAQLADKTAYFGRSLTGSETIGRTHGQLAAPMPASHRWGVLTQMVERSQARVDRAFVYADVGKLSGPMGYEDHGDEDRALESLGLRSELATQIIPRDRLAHLAHCLAETVTVCEAIATQVWLLAQSGIGELRLVAAGSVGSSAMPHKINPIVAENVRGLARMARPLAETLQLGIVQWGEHDLAHSSVERVAVPDLLHLACTALEKTTALVSGLVWVEPTIPESYQDTAEQLRTLQANGTPYVEAHAQLTALYRDGKIALPTEEVQ